MDGTAEERDGGASPRPLRIELGRLVRAVDVLLADGGHDVRVDVRPGIVELAALHVTGWSVVSLIPVGDVPADVLGARSVALAPLQRRLAELARTMRDTRPVVLALHADHVTVADRAVAAREPGRAPPRPVPADPPVRLVGLEEDLGAARFLDPGGRILGVDDVWSGRLRHFGPARFHGFAAGQRQYVQASAERATEDLLTALVMPAAVVDEW